MTKRELLTALEKYDDNEKITFVGTTYEWGSDWTCDKIVQVYKILGEKVIEDETEKINKGYKLTTLDFTEETLEMLNQYKKIKNMTFEEAVTDILMTVVKNPDILGRENNG